MTDEPGLPPRRGVDDLPPYAPSRAILEDVPDQPGSEAESPEPPPTTRIQTSPEAAEEAAAYAEAAEQGVLSDPPTTPNLEPSAESAGADAGEPESGPLSRAERRGLAAESARQARQARAASRLAASRSSNKSKHGGFRDEPIRTLVRGLGQLLITAGMVLLLFVVYEVYITDLFGAQKQAAAKESMEDRWDAAASTPPVVASESGPSTSAAAAAATPPPAADQVTDPGQRTRKYTTEIGQGFANLFIPSFGADYQFTIVEGTTADDLYGNPGHYDDTQYPGELGNFAVAGHRVSKGSPFNALGALNSCDAIVIETQDDWFVYRVLPMPEELGSWNPASRPQCADVAPLTGEYQDLPGREIVDPSDYSQVLPVPHVNANGPDAVAAATQRLITLTTCHPQFSDRERMIVHGVLTKSYAKTDGFLPPELSES